MIARAAGRDRARPAPLVELLARQERGQPALHRGDRPAAPGDGRDRRRGRRGAAPERRRHRAGDDPRHHRRPHRPARRSRSSRRSRSPPSSAAASASPCVSPGPRDRQRSVGELERAPRLDFVFPSPASPSPLQLQARADAGGRLRRAPRAAPAPLPRRGGRGLEELYAGRHRRGGRAPRLPLRAERRRPRRPSTTRSSPPRRRSGAGRTPRPSPSSRRAQAPRDDARHRGESAAPDRRRRQAGRDQVRPRPPRRARPGPGGHPRPRGGGRRPGAAGGLVLLDRLPPQPHRRPPRDVPSPTAARPSAIASAAGSRRFRAFAECCLAHVYVVAGDLREALEAGERALAIFEARGNVWWACRTLWGLSMAANALGRVGAKPRVLSPRARARAGR